MYKKLLVPLDGSATAQLALKHAEALARLSGASIILLSIVEEMHYSNGYERPKVYTEQVRPHFLATARALLEKAAKPLRDGGLSVAAHVVESGNHRVSELIVQQAKERALRPDHPGHTRPPWHRPAAAGQRCRAGGPHRAGAGHAGAHGRQGGLIFRGAGCSPAQCPATGRIRARSVHWPVP